MSDIPDPTDRLQSLGSMTQEFEQDNPTPEQAQVAHALIAGLTAANAFGQPIVTEVLPLDNYSAAEDYHQDFFARNPNQGYCMAVAAPKVAKFRKTFARLQKD